MCVAARATEQSHLGKRCFHSPGKGFAAGGSRAPREIREWWLGSDKREEGDGSGMMVKGGTQRGRGVQKVICNVAQASLSSFLRSLRPQQARGGSVLLSRL